MPGPVPIGALRCTSCGHKRLLLLDGELATALAEKLKLSSRKLARKHFSSNIGMFRCGNCNERKAEFMPNATHTEAKAGDENGARRERRRPDRGRSRPRAKAGTEDRARRERIEQNNKGQYKKELDYEPQHIDEGIGGNREDNKRARAKLWGEAGNRTRD